MLRSVHQIPFHAPQSHPNNNPRETETELMLSQAENPTPRISPESEAETGTGDPYLSRQESGDVRISMLPVIQEAIGASESLENAGIIEKEQDCFMRKTCVIIASMIIWPVLTTDETSPERKLETLGLIAFCCLAYTALENIIFYVRQNRAINVVKQRLFDAFDGMMALSFLICLHFWNEQSSNKYLLISSPVVCVISLVLYFRMGAGFSDLIRGMFYALQISLFVMNIQGDNTFDWAIIFIPFCFYLAGHQIYGSYILIKSSVRLYRQVGLEDLSFVRSCLRMSWSVIHHGLIITVFGVFVDLWNEAAIKEFKQSINIYLVILQVYNGFFLTFAVMFFRYVRKYDPELCENSNERSITSPNKPDLSREKYSLVAQNGLFICNFLKISPTYFIKANDAQNHNSQERSFESRETEEPCCYICEENQPDVIIMGCGHGGMCKECVLLSMEKNNNCMQCRKRAQSIYQIKNEDKALRIVEACEIFNIDYEMN